MLEKSNEQRKIFRQFINSRHVRLAHPDAKTFRWAPIDRSFVLPLSPPTIKRLFFFFMRITTFRNPRTQHWCREEAHTCRLMNYIGLKTFFLCCSFLLVLGGWFTPVSTPLVATNVTKEPTVRRHCSLAELRLTRQLDPSPGWWVPY